MTLSLREMSSLSEWLARRLRRDERSVGTGVGRAAQLLGWARAVALLRCWGGETRTSWHGERADLGAPTPPGRGNARRACPRPACGPSRPCCAGRRRLERRRGMGSSRRASGTVSACGCRARGVVGERQVRMAKEAEGFFLALALAPREVVAGAPLNRVVSEYRDGSNPDFAWAASGDPGMVPRRSGCGVSAEAPSGDETTCNVGIARALAGLVPRLPAAQPGIACRHVSRPKWPGSEIMQAARAWQCRVRKRLGRCDGLGPTNGGRPARPYSRVPCAERPVARGLRRRRTARTTERRRRRPEDRSVDPETMRSEFHDAPLPSRCAAPATRPEFAGRSIPAVSLPRCCGEGLGRPPVRSPVTR